MDIKPFQNDTYAVRMKRWFMRTFLRKRFTDEEQKVIDALTRDILLKAQREASSNTADVPVDTSHLEERKQ